MMTRPYFSSSNYIHNMSKVKMMDGQKYGMLYYNFINKHHNILRVNYTTSRQENKI